jgi:hypothetical protein
MMREIPLAFEENSHPCWSTSGLINSQESSHSLPPKGERQKRNLVMLADERSLGKWIARFKHSEGETNSKREQLMRREIPLIFA